MKLGIKKYFKELLFNNSYKKEHNMIFNSKKYWEERYLRKENSGSGSYGRLSEFKAGIINDFVTKNKIRTVAELGCGDGNQLKLASYEKYIGFDVSDYILNLCEKKFENDDSKIFFHYDEIDILTHKSELILSLDVIYHLIEDEVFHQYMMNLFSLSTKYVIIYSSNHEENKAPHVKCRKFTDWIDNHLEQESIQTLYIPNIYPFNSSMPEETSMSDFYIYERIKK